MRKFVLLLIVSVVSHSGHAEIFTWKDASGRIHFGDSPPRDRPVEEVVIKPNTYSAPAISEDNPFSGNSKKVVMYSATWCGVCKRAKRYFNTNKIPFTEYDIEKSTKGKRDYKKLNGKGVPIILVGKKRMNGFSPATFQSLYQ